MAISEAYKVPGSDEAEHFHEYDGGKTERRYRETWQVITDGNENRYSVLSYASLPVVATSTYTGDSEAVCIGKIARRIPGTIGYFEVEATFSTNFRALEVTQTRWRFFTEHENAVDGYLKSIETGNFDDVRTPITNSANDPLANTPPIEVARLMIDVEMKLEPPIPSWVGNYINTVNNDSFGIDGISFAPGQLRVAGLEISPVYKEGDDDRRNLSVTFAYRYEGWNLRGLDVGYHENRPNEGEEEPEVLKYRATLNGDNEPSAGLVLLDGQGRMLADGQTPVLREYRVYEELPFQALGLLLN